MLLNTTEEIGGSLMGKTPLKISKNTNFEKTCENFCCYLQHYEKTVSWFFCVVEPMNPNKFLIYGGIFLFGRRIMCSTESGI